MIRLDNYSNTLTLTPYSGDTLNSLSTINMPGYTYSQPQTFVNNNWIVPLQSYTI